MNEKILSCVYAAIDEANEERDGPPLEKALGTPLHGTAGELDSLALINFVVAVEEGLERELGVEVVLSDDRALGQELSPGEPSPFDSIGALVAYIDVLVGEQRGGAPVDA